MVSQFNYLRFLLDYIQVVIPIEQSEVCGERGEASCPESCQITKKGLLQCSQVCRCRCDDGWRTPAGVSTIPGSTDPEKLCSERDNTETSTCVDEECDDDSGSTSQKVGDFFQVRNQYTLCSIISL